MAQAAVLKLYKSVMEDVITGVREAFADEGVDEQVLQELKQMWDTKLLNTRAVETEILPPPTVNKPANQSILSQHQQHLQTQQQQQATMNQPQHLHQAQHIQQAAHQSQVPMQPQQQQYTVTDPNKLIPVQITIPAQNGPNPRPAKAITIYVPAIVLTGNHLQSILSSPAIAATFALPAEIASSTLQHQINLALQEKGIQVPQVMAQQAAIQSAQVHARTNTYLQQLNAGNTHAQTLSNMTNNMTQVDGADDANLKALMPTTSKSTARSSNDSSFLNHLTRHGFDKLLLKQLDGLTDTSDEDDDDDTVDDNDETDDKDDEENEDDNLEGGPEEEPLNSEDDVSEEDLTEMFDTDNVVVCQYDKITRSRNKWKFHLKDGIMNLAGKDYVFQKANGDAEW